MKSRDCGQRTYLPFICVADSDDNFRFEARVLVPRRKDAGFYRFKITWRLMNKTKNRSSLKDNSEVLSLFSEQGYKRSL